MNEDNTEVLFVLGDLLDEGLNHWLPVIVRLLYHTRGIEAVMLNPAEHPVNCIHHLLELSRSMTPAARESWLLNGISHLPAFLWRAENQLGKPWRPLELSLRELECHGGALHFRQENTPEPSPEFVRAWLRKQLRAACSAS